MALHSTGEPNALLPGGTRTKRACVVAGAEGADRSGVGDARELDAPVERKSGKAAEMPQTLCGILWIVR